MIIALLFVPLENLLDEFRKLDLYMKNNKSIHNIQAFCDYFKESYGKHIFKLNSIFSILSQHFWSVHKRVINDLRKTNNVLEGWNRSLNASIYQQNPSIYRTGIILKKEHAMVENKISKLLINLCYENNNHKVNSHSNEKHIVLNIVNIMTSIF
ncbi:hypothetical protein DMUE_1221 [Dictyocoela muelleri]|nr:hypothetical protein DMUE_1221 [Dictyocoela muelleri]